MSVNYAKNSFSPVILYLRRVQAEMGGREVANLTQLSPNFKPFMMLIAFTLVSCTIFRVSVLPYYLGSWSGRIATMGQYSLLALSAIYLLTQASRGINGIALFFPISTFFSTFATGNLKEACVRWLGWLLLFITVGPLVNSSKAICFRENLWRTWRFFAIPIALGSFFAYFAPLPHIGRGFYSGLMAHSMMLAPISATAVISSISITRNLNRRMGMIMVLICFISCLLSGSRSAMACCFLSATTTYLFAGKRVSSSILPLLIMSLVLGLSYQYIVDAAQDTAIGQYLKQKGIRNTRAKLWDTRINEFKSHPLFGLGISMSMPVVDEEAGGKNAKSGIESGSSWLSFLSMTGIVGTSAYSLLIISVLARFSSCWKSLGKFERAESLGVVAFVCLHTIFEGYALSFGSPLSMLFWLAWGRMADLGNRR